MPMGNRPRYPVERRLAGAQRRSGICVIEKILASAGIRNPAFQPVALFCTDWANPVPVHGKKYLRERRWVGSDWIILAELQTLINIYCMVLWRVRVRETPFGLLLRFIYDFTSRHYNYFYSVTRTRLTASSLPCCFLVLRCWSDQTFRLWSALVLLPWHCVSDRLLWSARFLFLSALK
jgi:hypothetical protein